MTGVSLFSVLLLALASLAYASDAWQLEKLALDVAGRLRGAQRVDRAESEVSVNRCADIVLSTMRDVAEAEAITDLMEARIRRQNFSVQWLAHDLKTVVSVADNIVKYNDKVRSAAWADIKRIREEQRQEFKARTLAVGRAMSVVRQLTNFFSAPEAGMDGVTEAFALTRARAAAAAAGLPTSASAAGLAAAMLPLSAGPGGVGVVAALPAGTDAEDERYYSAFLETEVDITSSASTEVDLGLTRAASAAQIAAAVANATRVHLYRADSSVMGLFGVLNRFLGNSYVNARAGFNPYTLRMLQSIAGELSAHQHGMLSFERLAATNFGHFDRYFLLAARRPLTLEDVTPLQAAVVRAQTRLTLVQHGLRENLLVLKDMGKISAQYKRALGQVRGDCTDSLNEFKRRSIIRKKALDLVETLIYPHVGAYGDLLGASEAEEIVRALAKIDPLLHTNGGWTPWRFTECDAPCGLGRQTLFRECANPAPQNGGALCAGRSRIRNYPCNVGLCNVHGKGAPAAAATVAATNNTAAAPAAPAAPAKPAAAPATGAATDCPSSLVSTGASASAKYPYGHEVIIMDADDDLEEYFWQGEGLAPAGGCPSCRRSSGGCPAAPQVPQGCVRKAPVPRQGGCNASNVKPTPQPNNTTPVTPNSTTPVTPNSTTPREDQEDGPVTELPPLLDEFAHDDGSSTAIVRNSSKTNPNATRPAKPHNSSEPMPNPPNAADVIPPKREPGLHPPFPGANDTVVPIPPKAPAYGAGDRNRPGFAPGSFQSNHTGAGGSNGTYAPRPIVVTSASFLEDAKTAFLPLPKIEVGSTPLDRGAYPSLSSNGDALLVADNEGNVYTYSHDAKGVWGQVSLPLQRFQVGYGQSSVLSPDGNSGIVCSKWRCALYKKTAQPKPLPLPTVNNTKPTVPAGNDYTWQKSADINSKVVRFPRPAASHDMATVLVADRCQLHQFQLANGAYTELPALTASQFDCRTMGWGINTAATLAAISGDGSTRVLVGSCARRAYCNDNERFSLVYVFVNGTRVARTVVPSATLSSASVSQDGSDIFLGAPLDRTSFHLARLTDNTYNYVYVDPTFDSGSQLSEWESAYRVKERKARNALVERASVEVVRTPKAEIQAAAAAAPAETPAVTPEKTANGTIIVPGANGTAAAGNATAASNSTAAAKATLMETSAAAQVEINTAAETETEAEAETELDSESESELDSESEADAEADAESEAESESDETMFVELETAYSAASSQEAQLALALAMEHEADMKVEYELLKASLEASLPSEGAHSLLESGAKQTHAAASRIAKIQAMKRVGQKTLAAMQAQSQIESAKTIDLPFPNERSVDLYFGNRVALSNDGVWSAVQALRNGRVSIEVYRRDVSYTGVPDRQFKMFQKIAVPWSVPSDFDGGLEMGGNATTITIGSTRGAVAVLTRARTTDRFVVPEMKW